jgi:hypothetical protein
MGEKADRQAVAPAIHGVAEEAKKARVKLTLYREAAPRGWLHGMASVAPA